MIAVGTLDLTPVQAPCIARSVVGKAVDFAALVDAAKMRNVASGALPHVTIHAGDRDLKVPNPGRPVYCVGGSTLPATEPARSREILRRLAYGYLDWASREVVGRYHRDLKRAAEPAINRTPGLPPAVLIRRTLRKLDETTIGKLAALTGMAQPNVSRTVAEMVDRGEMLVEKRGRETVCRLPPVMSVQVTRPNPDIANDESRSPSY